MNTKKSDEQRDAERKARLKVQLDSNHTFANYRGPTPVIGTIVTHNNALTAGGIKGSITSDSRWRDMSDRLIVELETKVVAIRRADTLEVISCNPEQEPILHNTEESWDSLAGKAPQS